MGVKLGAVIGGSLALVGFLAISAPRVLSEFRGYETWQLVSVNHPTGGDGMSDNDTLNVIVANPVTRRETSHHHLEFEE